MSELIDNLSNMSIYQLEAIYNRSWREHHNEIDVNEHYVIMQAIELVCGRKAIEITGYGGSWELVESKTQ